VLEFAAREKQGRRDTRLWCTGAHLSTTVRGHFAFLAELDDDERQIAKSRERDRPLALRLLADLPGDRLDRIGLY
jgi:hypothetical protein